MRGKNKNNWKIRKASLTVEAALVLPVFLFGILFIISFFQILHMQEVIQFALTETAKEASRYSYIYEDLIKDTQQIGMEKENKFGSIANQFVNGEFYHNIFSKYLSSEEIKTSIIEGNISFLNSQFMNDKNEIEIAAMYWVKPTVVNIFAMKGIPIIQCVKTKGFVGTYLIGNDYNCEREDKVVVYLAKNGTVYHKSNDCTHLLLSIEIVSFEKLDSYRNENGGKYTRCSNCMKGVETEQGRMVYIARQGGHYHSTKACSGLKRTVRKVFLSDVDKMDPCQRCGN